MLPSSAISPPFVDIEGVVNIRGVGGCPIASRGLFLKSPALFRSGEPSGITSSGKDQLLALGIRRVFDLRSDIEIAGYKTSTPAINGVEFVRVPVSQVQAYDPVSLAPRYVFLLRIIFAMYDLQSNSLESFETDEIGVSTFITRRHDIAYVTVSQSHDRRLWNYPRSFSYLVDLRLKLSSGIWETILQNCVWFIVQVRIVPVPGRFSNHLYVISKAGKDRTGVLVALLLMVSFTLSDIPENMVDAHLLLSVSWS